MGPKPSMSSPRSTTTPFSCTRATEPVGSDLFLDISFEPAETEAPRLFKVRTRPDRVVKVGEAIPLGLPSDKIYLFDQGGRRVYPQ